MMDKQKQLITEIMNDDAKDGLYKQQTAVEWLANKILKLDGINDIAIPDNLFEQAKQMEREQIEEGYNQGYRDGESDGWMNGDKDISNYSNANQYYTQTFGL